VSHDRATTRRPPRWSKKTDALVQHVAQRCRPSLQSELGRWLEDRPRFRDFVSSNQDKVRKKLSSADDEESRLDVRAELLVAYLLLADRRFEVAFEAYGSHQRGPDLTVTYRSNLRFNLEVTRLRTTSETDSVARLANVITGKLRQLPADLPNALVITTHGLAVDEHALAAAPRLLKAHSDTRDDAFFVRRGLKDARDFYARYLYLSAIVVLDEAPAATVSALWLNNEARRPLSKEVLSGLTRCLDLPNGGA
jgi:hypothetical protein